MPGRGLSTFSYPQVIPPLDVENFICYCQVVTMGDGSGGGKFHLNEDAPNVFLN